MADPIHNAVVGSTTLVEKEILAAPGPHFIRSYAKGAAEIPAGTLAARSTADGLFYPYVPGDAALGKPHGVAKETAAETDPAVTLITMGHVNGAELLVGGAAPDSDDLMALEERHIYPAG